MKKFTIVLAVTLVLACSRTFPSGPFGLYSLYAPQGTAAMMDKRDPDPGLFLYRDHRTRPAVEGFYTGLTGSSEISRAILHHASLNDIPLPLAFALAWGESDFNTRALNRNPHSVDRGLYQLNSRSFSHLKIEDFYVPEINAKYGLKHLRFCLNQSPSELVALAIYNAGIFKVQKGTPYTTLNHIARILEYREQLEDTFLRALAEAPAIARYAPQRPNTL